MNKRIRELMIALGELEGVRSESLSSSLKRCLRLVQLCPWLDDVADTIKITNAKSKTQATKPTRKAQGQGVKVAKGTEAPSQEGGARA